MRIRAGDTVKIIRGKDRGKISKVEKVFPKANKLVVAGANLYKKHVKPRQGRGGGIIEITKPLQEFQVQVICPGCQKPTRIGYQIGKGTKERICKKCGVTLDKPNKGKK